MTINLIDKKLDIDDQRINADDCINLWLAVLDRAVRDAKTLLDVSINGPTRKNKHHPLDSHIFYHDVLSLRRWFNSRSNRVGGFVWICDLLDQHPDRIRIRINQEIFYSIAAMMEQHKQRKEQHKQRKRLVEVLKKRLDVLHQ